MIERNQPYAILIGSSLLKSPDLISHLVKDDNYRLIEAADVNELEVHIHSQIFDLVIVEDAFPQMDLLDLVIKVRSKDPDTPIMLVDTGVHQMDEAKIWKFGIDDLIHAPLSCPELISRVKRSIKLRRLACQVQGLKEENTRLKQLSQTDGLTGLVNHRTFNEMAENELSRVRRFHGQLGCIMGDIDNFKNVNDTYGHITGEKILKSIAKILKDNIRSIDVVARYGGEEYVMLLLETSPKGVTFVAEKLRQIVDATNFAADDPQAPPHVTISIGAAQFPHSQAESYLDLVEIADHALYEAKRQGKNRVVFNN